MARRHRVGMLEERPPTRDGSVATSAGRCASSSPNTPDPARRPRPRTIRRTTDRAPRDQRPSGAVWSREAQQASVPWRARPRRSRRAPRELQPLPDASGDCRRRAASSNSGSASARRASAASAAAAAAARRPGSRRRGCCRQPGGGRGRTAACRPRASPARATGERAAPPSGSDRRRRGIAARSRAAERARSAGVMSPRMPPPLANQRLFDGCAR